MADAALVVSADKEDDYYKVLGLDKSATKEEIHKVQTPVLFL
jgi:hypothetical protein